MLFKSHIEERMHQGIHSEVTVEQSIFEGTAKFITNMAQLPQTRAEGDEVENQTREGKKKLSSFFLFLFLSKAVFSGKKIVTGI